MHRLLPLLCGLLLATSPALAQTSDLFPLGEKAPNVHHSGDIWLTHLSRADEDFDYSLAVATSAPGAYLNWHRHPAGQQLIVTEGTGLYQERGGEAMIMRRGDVIRCAPGVEHWHGALPGQGVTYLAISGNQRTEWLDTLTAADYQTAATTTTGFVERDLLRLSRDKWQWMADKNADQLAELFHDQAKLSTWAAPGARSGRWTLSGAGAFTTSRRMFTGNRLKSWATPPWC